MSLMLACLALTSCSLINSKVEPFICEVQPAYKKDGNVDTKLYAVNRDCLKGVNARLKACYKE